MTRLSIFIRENTEEILSEWETFARSLPVGSSMDIAALRDHAKEMLAVIALDLETPQTSEQQADKAHGRSDASEESSTAAQDHGAGRAESGFSIAQMVAEFRALRATVIRLWTRNARELAVADIDDLTRFNEAIDQAIAESVTRYNRDLSRTKDRFIAILGHDLRTPLGSIIGSAGLLLDTEDLRATIRVHIARMLKSAKRMNQMVGDILDFARIQFGGRVPIVPSSVDVRKIVEDVVSEVAASHPDADLRVECAGDLQGQWDGARLAQALTNLIANAVQHGSRKHPITVALHGMPNEVVISVANQGPTISDEKLSRIFDAVQLDKNVREESGHLGLGLYIVDNIVRGHGGSIDARSSEGQGTTFTIHLPR